MPVSVALGNKVKVTTALKDFEPIQLLTGRSWAINCTKCFHVPDMPSVISESKAVAKGALTLRWEQLGRHLRISRAISRELHAVIPAS